MPVRSVIRTLALVAVLPALAAAPASASYTVPLPPWWSSTDLSAGIMAEFNALPTIVELSPASGPAAGGQTIAITGSYFRDGTGVTFGGVPASAVAVESGTRLTAVTPPHAAGTVEVVVLTYAGASNAVAYHYVAPPVPPPAAVPPPVPVPTAEPAAETCTVPDVRELTVRRARRVLRAAGCRLGGVTRRHRRGRARVHRQGAEPGTVLPAGTAVDVRARAARGGRH